MVKKDSMAGIIFIIIGALFIVPSVNLGIPSATSDGVPGAGFFPFVTAIILIILGSVLLLDGIFKKNKDIEKVEVNKENLKVLLVTIVAIIVFLLIWKFTSFIIATVALSLFLNWYYKRDLKFNIIFTAIFVTLIHVVFTILLRIQFVI